MDHAFIIAGGEITKQARNWLGGKLDASKRSQIMFMDRDDILSLFAVSQIPLPAGAIPAPDNLPWDGDIPFLARRPSGRPVVDRLKSNLPNI